MGHTTILRSPNAPGAMSTCAGPGIANRDGVRAGADFSRIVLKSRPHEPIGDLGEGLFCPGGRTMLIGGISSMSSTAAVFNPVLVPRPSSDASKTATAVEPAPKMISIANQATLASSGANAPAGGSSGGRPAAGGSPASAAGSSAAEQSQVSSYSMSVAGQQYWGSVEKSGGDYTASVPNLAGATAAGLSEQAAENNLNTRIDELV